MSAESCRQDGDPHVLGLIKASASKCHILNQAAETSVNRQAIFQSPPADILEVSRNNARFPSAVRSTTLTSQSGEARARAITGTPHLVRSLVQMDEPDHMKYRLLTQAWFMPANVRKRSKSTKPHWRSKAARIKPGKPLRMASGNQSKGRSK